MQGATEVLSFTCFKSVYKLCDYVSI